MVQRSPCNKSQEEQDKSVPLAGATSLVAIDEGNENASERADSQTPAIKGRRKETAEIALSKKSRSPQIVQKLLTQRQ
eukprot:10615167-Ditylum_brightwellii.AAC.1